MKTSKHISDEQLAAYLDKMLSAPQMSLLDIQDVDTLEVLSVSREASKNIQQKTSKLPSWETTSQSTLLNSIASCVPFAQAGFLGDTCIDDENEDEDMK